MFFGGTMAFAQNRGTNQPSLELRPVDRLTLGLIGMGVIFASLGAGEAVYRLAFFDFDGATDRLPIEMLFGLMFAWMTTKVARKIYQNRMETSAQDQFDLGPEPQDSSRRGGHHSRAASGQSSGDPGDS